MRMTGLAAELVHPFGYALSDEKCDSDKIIHQDHGERGGGPGE